MTRGADSVATAQREVDQDAGAAAAAGDAAGAAPSAESLESELRRHRELFLYADYRRLERGDFEGVLEELDARARRYQRLSLGFNGLAVLLMLAQLGLHVWFTAGTGLWSRSLAVTVDGLAVLIYVAGLVVARRHFARKRRELASTRARVVEFLRAREGGVSSGSGAATRAG